MDDDGNCAGSTAEPTGAAGTAAFVEPVRSADETVLAYLPKGSTLHL